MWITEESAPVPLAGLYSNDHGTCILAANAKLEAVYNVMQMVESLDEDLFFDDEFPAAEEVPLPKKGKITSPAEKKRKPKV
jgi:hypothetical protein